MRAAEHAPSGPFNVLERRHGLAEIVEGGAGARVEYNLLDALAITLQLFLLVGSEKLPTGATPKSRQKPGRKREMYLKSSGPISQSSSCAWRMSSNTSSRTTPNGRVGANSVEASRLRRETRRGNNDNNLYRLCLSKEIPESYVSKRSFKEPLGIGATRTFLKIARDHPPRGSNRPCTCA